MLQGIFTPLYSSPFCMCSFHCYLRWRALGLNSGGWFPLLGALGLAAGLMYALMKYREWYVINLIGLIVAIGITAILGMSLGILSSIILLIIMAAYDAIAVYKTKHMITLAEGVAQMRLPILFVVPKSRDFTMDRLDETGITQSEGGEREAFFMGVGDTVIPGILAVSASLYLPNTTSFCSRPTYGQLLGPLSED